MQNRELSWLTFNECVLQEAIDVSVPLLERLKFITIFSNNLDEFFMIRVGSLTDLSCAEDKAIDNKTGMSPTQQLEKIYSAVVPLYEKKDTIYSTLSQTIKAYGIGPLEFNELNPDEHEYVKRYYKNFILPVLSPQIVDQHHPFPHIQNKVIHITARLKNKSGSILGLIQVPPALGDVLSFPECGKYIHVEKIIYEYAESIFHMYEMQEKNYICVTRNADISLDDEVFDVDQDFRMTMAKALKKRKRLSVVRLEAAKAFSDRFEEYICEKLLIDKSKIYITTSPMRLKHLFVLGDGISVKQQRQLNYPDFTPQPSPGISPGMSIMRQIEKKDLLLSYPYESMDTFLQLIKEASESSSVISIKITIYRVANKSKLIEYLCNAAENGKEVFVIVELRARFDEQNNIDWCERLEEAGCIIMYGFEEYKVHSKICLITKRNGKDGISYITQIATGNYNERTAKLYTDLSLTTANQEIGEDANDFFRNMGVADLEEEYKHLIVAPSMKDKILNKIAAEAEKGEEGRITIKVNSITDYDILEYLAEASRAGVRINMIVRGICCLLPGVPEHTENVNIIRIVGRFLEHARIYSFGEQETQQLYISSADLMTRNMERRIEIAVPVFDTDIKKRINKMIDVMLNDNTKAYKMNRDGSYTKKSSKDTVPINSQEYFMQEAEEFAKIPSAPQEIGIIGSVRSFFRRP
ncbi:MAG: polyphosphate kinase 1 [Synergistaceae bacterium]|nr:polyphosphate kinase 1 [Synergistaceae bacterium]